MTIRDNDETLLTRILESPRLPFYARQIQTVLNDEQDARHRFYEAITEGDKAEFINGEPVFHSPVRLEHNQVGQLLLTLLSTYVRINDLGYVGYEKIMISLSRNDYEPDLCYFRKETAAQFKPRQMHFPAPYFIVDLFLYIVSGVAQCARDLDAVWDHVLSEPAIDRTNADHCWRKWV